jgi:threonine/homoserine/homoserine lactone efflux protein
MTRFIRRTEMVMPAEFIFLSLSLIGAIYLVWLVTEVSANQH